MPIYTLALVTLVLMPLAALAAPPHVAKLVGSFHESENVDVKVSGSVIVGVASINASNGKAVRSLQLLHAPTPANRQVCLTVQSRDGVYLSRNTFELPEGSAKSMVQIPYNHSTRLGRLARYGADELAISASTGSCANRANTYYVVDATATKPPESLRIFVNSFGATDVFYRTGSRGPYLECTPIEEGRHTTFDFWCSVPWPRAGSDRLEVEIQRETYGRELPAVALTLYLKSGH